MNRRTIYLAGGCYWGVEKFLSNILGVLETEVGFANGHVDAPAYVQVKQGDTGHAETVRTVYDADQLPLDKLLRLFFRIIDPTSFEKQGEDVGNQYRTGVYWVEPEDEAVIRTELARLQQRFDAPIVVEACLLDCFFPAEEYHQKYLDKTPGGYCHVPWSEIDWVKTVDLTEI
ncbi:MAG: peptide-methionine (S)-S-oxide reductase MsrA [Clostridia bacterium]|nr:peptide-methionine (S)-S-oxide reductase MsrA [Clostridia bacterium]